MSRTSASAMTRTICSSMAPERRKCGAFGVSAVGVAEQGDRIGEPRARSRGRECSRCDVAAICANRPGNRTSQLAAEVRFWAFAVGKNLAAAAAIPSGGVAAWLFVLALSESTWYLPLRPPVGVLWQGVEAALLAVATVFLVQLSRLFASRGRRVALFLRRFRAREPYEVVRDALTRGMGRRWCVVTLDDRMVEPLGIYGHRRNRWMQLAGLGVAGGLLLLGWRVFPSELLERLCSDCGLREMASIFPLFWIAWSDPSNDVVYRTLQDLMFAIVASVAVGTAAGAMIIHVVSNATSMTRADRNRRVRAEEPAGLGRVFRRLHRRLRSMFGPRLIVVTVATQIWQDAVKLLSSPAAIVVMDVSEPSPSLLWEVEWLQSRGWPRMILLMNKRAWQSVTQHQKARRHLNGSKWASFSPGNVSYSTAAMLRPIKQRFARGSARWLKGSKGLRPREGEREAGSRVADAQLVFCPASNLFERNFAMAMATVLPE